MATTAQEAKMTPKPDTLMGSIKWNLAMMPLTPESEKDADTTDAEYREMVKVHQMLRAEYGMNPDIYKRGDA